MFMKHGLSTKLQSLLMAFVIAFSMPLPTQAQDDSAQVDPQRAAYYDAFKGKKLVFISENQASEQGQVWYKSMQDTLLPLGMSVSVRDTKYDTSVGAQAFQEAIADGANVIAVWNADRSSYARLIQQAEHNGIYIVEINMGSSAPGDSFVGPDWQSIMRRQIDATAAFCTGKSEKIAIVGGITNSAVDVLGMEGVDAGLKAHPELKVVSHQYANWDANQAKDITAAVLQQHPDLCGVVGSWNLMDEGEAAAISEAGLKGKVFLSTSGSGLSNGACDRVKDGTFNLYVSYNTQMQYVQIATVLQTLISSQLKPGTMTSVSYTPLTNITSANAGRPALCWSLDQFSS
jgi:ribose transport system substrate-binding protein